MADTVVNQPESPELQPSSDVTPADPTRHNVASTSSRQRLSRRRRRCLMPVACVTAFILVMNAGISMLLAQWQQPETVSFDMTGTVNNFMAQVAGRHLSDDEVRSTTARFNTVLNAALTDWQRHHRAVILVAPAVVSGARDITADVQAEVANRMAEGDRHE
jgi:type-F conjugative transfer system protein TrbI